MHRFALFGLLISLALLPGAVFADEDGGDFDHSYAGLDGVLKARVDARGMVDYEGLKSEPALDAFLSVVASVPPEQVGGWSRSAQIAFYTNAYNAITLKAILDASPIASIRDIQPNAWDHAKWPVAGRTVSLNWIEHTKLRNNLK